ncbi:MAG TPA: hypothetical protein VIL43_06590 [Burkholderiales bacterium]
MSVAQMRDYARLGRRTMRAQRELLLAHREHVRRVLAEWMEALALLDASSHYDRAWERTGVQPREAAEIAGRALRRMRAWPLSRYDAARRFGARRPGDDLGPRLPIPAAEGTNRNHRTAPRSNQAPIVLFPRTRRQR